MALRVEMPLNHRLNFVKIRVVVQFNEHLEAAGLSLYLDFSWNLDVLLINWA